MHHGATACRTIMGDRPVRKNEFAVSPAYPQIARCHLKQRTQRPKGAEKPLSSWVSPAVNLHCLNLRPTRESNRGPLAHCRSEIVLVDGGDH